MLTIGSLFAGIGGFDCGFQRAGLSPLWHCENDSDAQRVIRHHWPDRELIEDVRDVKAKRLAKVDVVCGGFPCQDLSVAGKRAGLDGKRSGLWWEMLRVIRQFRPRLVVWENVPGLLSSDSRRDLVRVVSSLAKHDYFGCVRTLDAQHFGVPQRRRRLFGVFAPGRAGTGLAAEILSIAQSVPGHPATGRQAGQDIAGPIGSGTPGRGWSDDLDRAGAFVPKVGFTLRGVQGGKQSWNSNLVAATLRSRTSNAGVNPPGRGGEDDANLVIAPPVTSNPYGDHESREGLLVAAVGGNRTSGPLDVATAVNACKTASGRQDFETETFITSVCLASYPAHAKDLAMPSTARNGDPGVIQSGPTVRRLMPVECCRLQGFPDDWLDLEPPLSDSAKYRLLGNAVAVPVAEWIGRRIVAAMGGQTAKAA